MILPVRCGKRSVRYSEFYALSPDRFAGEVTYALIWQSRWAWKQPSNATEVIWAIVTEGKGGSLRGCLKLGRFLENFNPITAWQSIQFVVSTVYPSSTLWKNYLDKANGPPQGNRYWAAPQSHSQSSEMHIQDSSSSCSCWSGFCSLLPLGSTGTKEGLTLDHNNVFKSPLHWRAHQVLRSEGSPLSNKAIPLN